jgi:putative addiction module component (TIGR02574 family)
MWISTYNYGTLSVRDSAGEIVMKNASKSIENQVLELPAIERLKLAEKLLSSLEPPGEKLDALWADESEVRIDAYERGELEAVPINDVFRKYDKD